MRSRSGALLAVTLAVVGTAVVTLPAAKPPSAVPLTATFRCAQGDSAACGESDGLRADLGGAYAGQAQTGEGAFINPQGGFTLRLMANVGAPERHLDLALGPRLTSYTACGLLPTLDVEVTEAEMRVNVEGPNGTTLGLNNLDAGQSYPGFGIMNYRDPAHANVWWTVRWGSGALLVTRTVTITGANSWDIRSSSPGHPALLQCTRQKGKNTGGDEGLYHLPFALTAVRPAP